MLLVAVPPVAACVSRIVPAIVVPAASVAPVNVHVNPMNSDVPEVKLKVGVVHVTLAGCVVPPTDAVVRFNVQVQPLPNDSVPLRAV